MAAPTRTAELPLESADVLSLALMLAKKVVTHPNTLRAGVVAVALTLAYVATRKKKSLRGKTVVLTGAATGLGRAQAFELAKQGAKVIAWDINIEQLEKTCQEVRAAYPDAQVAAYGVNLANREAVYALADKVKAEHGFVWGLINNAGIISGAALMDTPDKKIELTMAVNTHAHFWTIKSFLPEMMNRNDGHIVAISSAAGFFGSARMIDYAASKFAVRGLMESLRLELASMGKSGVKTTLAAPGHIATPLFEGYSLGFTMKPEYVASQVIEAMRCDYSTLFVPHLPLMMGNMWQNILPASLFDLFMLPTNSQMAGWNPTQANKIFARMEQ